MSLQPRTAAPGKARRAASAGKPRTKKNAAKAAAPKTTRRYSDGPKGTPTRKEERNLERSKLRAKRYQEKIAPKAKTTSRADEFVAKRNSDTRPTTRREAAKADPANDGRPNFVPQKRTKWIPGQKPRKPETERPDTTRANRTERTFKPRSTTDSRTVNKTYSGKKSTTAYPRTHTREAVDFGAAFLLRDGAGMPGAAEAEAVERFVLWCRRGPPLARVAEVAQSEAEVRAWAAASGP